MSVLSSISQAPVLASVEIERGWREGPEPVPSDAWTDMDGFLTRIAGITTTQGGFVVTMRQWSSDELVWEEIFPKFREAGGKIRTVLSGWDEWD